MKKFIYLLAAAFMLLSCTKELTTIIVVPEVEVQLDTRTFFNVEQSELITRSTHIHQYPTEYKAYFVSNENKGDYVKDQLVTTINVVPGLQTIVVPKLNYKVYVTNYDKTGDWYIWNDAIEQLPRASFELYLYGKNTIDYVTQTVGEVKVNNPYSAIFINKEFLDPARTPREFDGGLGEYNTFNSEWFYMFVRKRHNSQVWITQYNGNKSYQWSEDVVANKIYRYRFNNDPGTTDEEGNFTVIVDPWGDEYDETISVL